MGQRKDIARVRDRFSLLLAFSCLGWAGCGGEPGSPGSAQVEPSQVLALHPAHNVSQDPELPAAPQAAGRLRITPIGGYLHGKKFATSAAEIIAYDSATKRLFVVNGEKQQIDILEIADPATPKLVGTVDVGQHGDPTSIASHDGKLAACVTPPSRGETGKAVFFNAQGEVLKVLDVGHKPDMLTFSPNGRWLLVSNEGAPEPDYSFDPEGSISQIDLADGIESLKPSHVTTLDFRKFNDQRESLDSSIRIFGPGATVAQDLESEYIAVSPDSKTAWIVCQENNAVAIADLEKKEITRLVGLGFKDYSLEGNGFDASDKDDKTRIRPWPVKGMYQPDGTICFTAEGKNYLISANEGKHRGHSGFSEDCRVKDLKLDPAAFPNAKELQKKEHLGRLKTTTATGDANGDGLHEEIYSYGARSFTIWNADASLVFDSGDQFERILAELDPKYFNSDHESHALDNRSDNKGPEPEGVVVGEIDGRTYAFILLERMSGFLVYDISDPTAPVFDGYVQTRDYDRKPDVGSGGDLGPEGGVFIPGAKSPTGKPLLAVSYEVSGTTRIFEITATP
ncbi:MAG: choice-of-anchor I family protein [Pirellulaceae bacterium]